ncbi:MAG: SLBB domain-containing protein [Nitrospirota bacterium]|nr:SLBB domain-containing protein [Nitrospirota bacterium]
MGDLETARKIYEDFKETYKDVIGLDTTGMDPMLAEEINRAIKNGNFKIAKKLIAKFQKLRKKKPTSIIGIEDIDIEEDPSIFERTLSGDFPTEILKAELKQFGYDLFQKKASRLSPSSMSMPVGPDYIIGPGDQLSLTLWGTAEGIFMLFVTKEGTVTLPKVGVVSVAGLRFGELENTLRRHLSKYFTNFNISVAMGKVKTITVYLVGELVNPGSYSINSLTTLYGALASAGGPSKRGSLRNIQVVRNGKVVKTIDLYDFLIRGDRTNDIKLQHEDTILVPLIGPIVGVKGSVYRPAIYELLGHETIGEALQMAGNIMPIGVNNRLQVSRFTDTDNQKKIIKDINLDVPVSLTSSSDASLKEKVRNMDVISVQPLYDKVWEKVNLQGDVRNPGDYQWREGLRVKDVIMDAQLLPTSALRNVEVIRLSTDFLDRKVIPIDLDALMKGDSSQNITLLPKDLIRVYTTYREVEKVTIKGEVLRPAEYEIYKGERLSDFLLRVGGFTREAYPYGTVLKRKDVKLSQAKNMQAFISRMQSQMIQSAAGVAGTAVSAEEAQFAKAELELNRGLLENLKSMQEQMEGRVAINITENIESWKGTKDDLLLQDGDTIMIPKRPQEILVLGEVHSIGAQVYIPDFRVRDYLNQTGGLTNYADDSQIFVLQANGLAFSSDSPDVGNIEKMKLKAGDTIFVPQKIERYAIMRFTKDIIDILFKTAVTLATITVIF